MRLKTKRNIFTGLKTITAALLIILQVYPIFYVIISSMKTTDDFRSLPSYALPSALNFENYIKVFTTSPMLNYFKNSIIITVGVLIPLLLISFMAGFALSKIQFRGNKKILSYFLLGLMLPFQVALIPLFTIFSKMGILNTYPAVILPQIAFSLSYSIQLFYSFSKFLPDEIIEAAIIDGCSPMRTFFKIVFPLLKPTTATLVILNVLAFWNDYLLPSLVLGKKNLYTLPLSTYSFYGTYSSDYGVIMAALVLTVAPILVLYLFLQKEIIDGVVAGAVKS